MTEQFEKWFDVIREKAGLPPSYRANCVDFSDAHFWLTAFVKEVEQRAVDETGLVDSYTLQVYYAFKKVVRDFGLEERKP